jgi:uncharacterized protein (TIGR03435 family)
MALEDRMVDVYVLTAPNGQAAALKEVREQEGGWDSTIWFQSESRIDSKSLTKEEIKALTQRRGAFSSEFSATGIGMSGGTMEDFSKTLERSLDRPVVNETNMHRRYSIAVETKKSSSFAQMLRDNTGLVLTPDRRTVRVLNVRGY